MFLPIENQPGLIADLEGDPFVGHALSSATCELYHRYGMFLVPLTAAMTTLKYCQFGQCCPVRVHDGVDEAGEPRDGGGASTVLQWKELRRKLRIKKKVAAGRAGAVARLPAVVAALNGEVTRLTGKKPSNAIKAKTLRRGTQKPSSVVPGRPVGLEEQKVPSGVGVLFLYQPGELEGGRRRATDPMWSLEVHRLQRSVTKPDELLLYYLQDGPQRGFVREELLIVPPDT